MICVFSDALLVESQDMRIWRLADRSLERFRGLNSGHPSRDSYYSCVLIISEAASPIKIN